MKRIVFRSLIIATAMSSAAYAAETTTQYFYQAPAMTHVFNPSLSYGQATQKDKGGAGDDTTTGFDLGLGYLYGIDEDMAVGVNLGFSNASTSVEPANSALPLVRGGAGMTDLGLRFQGRVPMVGPGNLIYGARANLSLLAASQDLYGGRNNGIGYSFLAPYVGYEWDLGFGTVGAKLDYELVRTNRKLKQSLLNGTELTATNKPGAKFNWSLFYEMNMHDVTWGLSADIIETTSSNRSTTQLRNLPAVDTVDPASQDLMLRLYGNYAIDKDFSIQPAFSYTQLMNKYREGVEMENDTEWNVTVAARFGF